jgi:hypothetical protein
MELAVIFKQSEMHEVMRKVCQVLGKFDAKVNSSCGLHVHLDARNRVPQDMVDRLVRAQDLLYHMVPKARLNSTYCKKTLSKNMNTLDRYQGINKTAFRKYGSIEVRIHSGSTSYAKITNWIEVLLKIIDTDYKRLPSTLKGLEKTFKFNDVLMGYIKERLTKFSGQHNQNKPYKRFLESKPRVVQTPSNLTATIDIPF